MSLANEVQTVEIRGRVTGGSVATFRRESCHHKDKSRKTSNTISFYRQCVTVATICLYYNKTRSALCFFSDCGNVLVVLGLISSLDSTFRRTSSGQDVAAHGLRAHGRLVLAQVQVSVGEEVGKVGDTADVLQRLHNHHVLRQ